MELSPSHGSGNLANGRWVGKGSLCGNGSDRVEYPSPVASRPLLLPRRSCRCSPPPLQRVREHRAPQAGAFRPKTVAAARPDGGHWADRRCEDGPPSSQPPGDGALRVSSVLLPADASPSLSFLAAFCLAIAPWALSPCSARVRCIFASVYKGPSSWLVRHGVVGLSRIWAQPATENG